MVIFFVKLTLIILSKILSLIVYTQVKIVQIGSNQHNVAPMSPNTTTDDKVNLLMFDLLGNNAETDGLKQRAVTSVSMA